MRLDTKKVEVDLAKELLRQKVEKARQQREIEKICDQSDELREFKEKIRSAFLNKERSAQLAEQQYRKQKEIVCKITYLHNRTKKRR